MIGFITKNEWADDDPVGKGEAIVGNAEKTIVKDEKRITTLRTYTISFVILMVILCTFAITRQITDFRWEHETAVAKTEYEYAINKLQTALRNQDDVFKKGMETQKSNIATQQREQLIDGLTLAILELQPKLDTSVATKIVEHLIKQSELNSIDPILVAAIIYEESRFNPMAHSKKGAVGLMQVRYSTWKKQPILKDNGVSAKSKLYWIDLNILVGTNILADYYKESKYDIVKTLHRYNSGSTSLPKGKTEHEISYANKVLLTAFKIRTMMKNITKAQANGDHNQTADK